MRNALFAEQQNALEQDIIFRFVDDGLDDTKSELDEYGMFNSPRYRANSSF